MRRVTALTLLVLMSGVVLFLKKSHAESNEAEIRQLWDRWAKAFREHDINGIMAMYAPQVVAYDFVHRNFHAESNREFVLTA